MKITIIGKGKLGRTISYILNSKSIKHSLLGRKERYRINGLVYICVPENQIEIVAKSITGATVVIHASGALDLKPLDGHECVGILHPIMTFLGPEYDIPSIPIPATCSGDKDAIPLITSFAKQLNFTVYPYEGSRTLYHCAAVLSGNFSTILLHSAAKVLSSQGVPYEDALQMLHPLMLQSVINAPQGILKDVLTGPLQREQTEVINKQIKALNSDSPELSTLYQSFIEVYLTFFEKNP
jgi:predicted short-subunit dehydrogenase-like oxidoreductase (DUF2520 family)